MNISTYVNEVDDKWILSFGSPLLPNYEGPTVEVPEELAKEILAVVK